MQGRILSIDPAGRGLVLGGDGLRYPFSLAEWNGPDQPAPGIAVDFLTESGEARAVFPLPPQFAGMPYPGAYPVFPPAGGVARDDNSVVLGSIGVGCLALSFLVPVVPLIAAIVLGLIGSGQAKRYGNRTGLLLSRFAWIGALVLIAFGIAILVVGLSFLFSMFAPLFNEIAHNNLPRA